MGNYTPNLFMTQSVHLPPLGMLNNGAHLPPLGMLNNGVNLSIE